MKIEAVRTAPVLAPLPRPLSGASGQIERMPLVLIDVITGDGVEGRAYAQMYFPELLPALDRTIRGCAKIAAAVATPVQIGENFQGPAEMQAAVEAGAMDCVMPDAQFIHGVTGWLEAAALARVAGVPMSSHMFVEASAHLLCATPTAHWLECMDVAAGVLAQPTRVEGGAIAPADRPGIGMEWDPDAVRRCRVDQA